MTRIVVISFEDTDVSKGLEELVRKYPDPFLVFPITEDYIFVESVYSVISAHNVPFHAYIEKNTKFDHDEAEGENFTTVSNSVKEVLKQVGVNDVFAIAWQDSMEDHAALHSVEDFAVDSWDISDGLDQIVIADDEEIEEEEVMDLITESVSGLVELIAGYVTTKVIRLLANEIRDHLDENLPDTDPFEE
jgi:hypothetical protein